MDTPTLALKPDVGAFALELLCAIGYGLSQEDQKWLAAHLEGLPAYFRSEEGAQVMAAVVRCYRTSNI